MDSIVDTSLVEVISMLKTAAYDAAKRCESGIATDSEILAILNTAGELRRITDSVLVTATAQVQQRSTGQRDERLTTKLGHRTAADVVQAATRCSHGTAFAASQAAKITAREVSLTTGELLPGQFPQLTEALNSAEIGLDQFRAATGPLHAARSRISTDVMHAADAALADAARGKRSRDGQAIPPLDAEDLATVAAGWVAWADPDGATPKEELALRKRGLRLGKEKDGVVPITGNLLSDVAAQFSKLIDAINNPRSTKGNTDDHDPAPADHDPSEPNDSCEPSDRTADASDAGRPADPLPGDERNTPQKWHDAFASILGLAARSTDAPTVGGAAPYVTLTMPESDFTAGTGYATTDTLDVPVSWLAARHAACTGRVQRVVHDENGKIVHIEITDRIFNPAQRRAIIARDRECVIPGCDTRASWCEIHHVEEHSRGGPTSTSNGVLLCWYHHRTLGLNGWEVRMRDGMPEVRGPRWWDRSQSWHRIPSPLAA